MSGVRLPLPQQRATTAPAASGGRNEWVPCSGTTTLTETPPGPHCKDLSDPRSRLATCATLAAAK